VLEYRPRVMVRKTRMSDAPAPETFVPDLPDALAVADLSHPRNARISAL